MNILRNDWPRALCQLNAAEIKAVAASLSSDIEVRDVVLPQAGLGLLSLTDGAFHEPFYLGEIPVARAEVILKTTDGREVQGGSVLVDDRAQLARSIAILDAILSGKLPGCDVAEKLVKKGELMRMQKISERRQMLAATRVDFSLLEQEDDEDAE
ncbi:phosphonate C-P lyase system protein PhnG [Gallionella capsiferriformans]|jgi:alpha-D-ribose 1-methylphosphonate 5-triphosphate synthase subunit PhnG|uniref:Phosphonate C-P lyase system protein PhnG n=1 Tax=Gallionella capsiferriformans (strain ES-2) TaxID=395494 RepID=D9SDE2_GALCS|nr:phosphonate C-P lyase system protein PhnG [Gallionella capsiferriformans]ADL56740.1 phosphonate C-P lyase system protein PhnG [Gallionella capsiferriformans ES-2]